MGPRILWASSASAAILLLVGAVPALAHPTAPPPEPDPTERSLFLIAQEPASDDRAHAMPVALSQDANGTSTSSLAYQFTSSALQGGAYCAGYPGCPGVKLQAVLAEGETDFELVPEKEYVGQLHVAWTYRENLPNGGLWSSTVGRVDIGLAIGDVSYGSLSKGLVARGSASGDIMWAFTFAMHGERPGNGSHGHGPSNASSTPAAEAWAHDVVLYVSIMPYYGSSPSAILGSQLVVKLDTGGGSWLRVHEAIPPPPPPVPPAETAMESSGSGLEDGVDEEIELYFTPGPSLPLVALSVIAGLFALRRRRDA